LSNHEVRVAGGLFGKCVLAAPIRTVDNQDMPRATTLPATSSAYPASDRLRERMRTELTFQISVDVDNIPLGLDVAEAALAGGVTILEMGTPLLKTEGVRNVVPAFRARFPGAILLADMKTMDGGAFEARGVFAGGANVIDFLALAGAASARNICAVRDEFRAAEPDVPRLVFADILVPQQGPAGRAVEVAEAMLEAGVDGVGVHLQLDARRADPALFASGLLSEVARAIHAAVGDRASVQVVGGLTLPQAQALARDGLRAFVISGNFGHEDEAGRYTAPGHEITRDVAAFIAAVSSA
jgi:3-keto-L-gulonate-6-phosphate decarboxylase